MLDDEFAPKHFVFGQTLSAANRSQAHEHLWRMPYTVYILKCNDDSLYVGCTNNLQGRIKEHNKSKKGAHYTKIRRPVVLMHTEEYTTLEEARKRESEIKRWRRGKKLKLITGIKNKGTRHL